MDPFARKKNKTAIWTGLSAIPLTCMALLPTASLAFQPLITDDTGTQGTGGNQLEVAYNRTVDKAPGTRETTHEVPLVFTRGLTNALDVYVGISRLKLLRDAPTAAEHGWSNTAIGAKWRFHADESSKLSFALKPEIQVPVSRNREDRGLGTGRISYGLGLLMTQETGFGAVHANLVVDRVNYVYDVLNEGERRTLYRLSVAPVWDVTEDWKLALDAGLNTNPDRAARPRMGYVEIGAIYSPSEDIDLAVGVVRNVMDNSADTTQATVGITWRFR